MEEDEEEGVGAEDGQEEEEDRRPGTNSLKMTSWEK